MSDAAEQLKAFEPTQEFFVGIDSDGCVFDSMEIKHKECFTPMFIKHFGLQPVSKYAREVWEFVNLYSKTRGINRFPALSNALHFLKDRHEVQARHVQIRKKSSILNRKHLSSRNDNREVRERLKTRALMLWGGKTKKHKKQRRKNVLPFVLANVAGYVALYQGAELSGGAVRFITISCWGIWGLWLLTSNYWKHLVGEVVKHPQETLLTFAAMLLNSSVDGIAASDERGDDTFLEKQDIEQRPVEPGKDCLFPK